jgi:hypothetical protein
MNLPEFVEQAYALAADPKEDQIVRQTALRYLQLAPGGERRKLLPLLSERNGDIRLSAIQMFAHAEGLSAEDKDALGPLLIRVALDDPSPGHRQEAIHTLGCWEDSLAEPFFRQVLEQNPPVTILDGHYNDERYWQYRFRLVALLALARLKDDPAREELLTIHEAGGPTEKMDVLLAFMELGQVPDGAMTDLRAEEPKLIATAARLIHEHGTPAQQEQMQQQFRAAPLWLEFRNSGADDHLILTQVGLGADE